MSTPIPTADPAPGRPAPGVRAEADRAAVRAGLRNLARNLIRAGHEPEARIALKAEELLRY